MLKCVHIIDGYAPADVRAEMVVLQGDMLSSRGEFLRGSHGNTGLIVLPDLAMKVWLWEIELREGRLEFLHHCYEREHFPERS